MAKLFVGRSLLNLNRHEEAIVQLKLFFEENKDLETLRSAALTLLDASSQLNDLASFDFAVQKLNPSDPELPKAYFSRAQMLKKSDHFALAKQQLEQILTQFPSFPQKGEVAFELAHLEYKDQAWESCRNKCIAFLAEYPEHPLASFGARYLVAASTELAARQPLLRPQLITDLNTFLASSSAPIDKTEWELLLAKTHYELGHFEQAIAHLEPLQTPNALLLHALVLRDEKHDLEQFVTLAEKALDLGATLIEPAQIHTALFSAYIELSNLDKGAEHLYQAFLANSDIKTENLLWLAERFSTRLEETPSDLILAGQTAEVLAKCKAALHLPKGAPEDASSTGLCIAALHLHEGAPEDASSEDTSSAERIVCKLAEVYSLLGRVDDSIALLKSIEFPSEKRDLLLAEALAKKGILAEAIQMFDAIVSSSATMRDPISASASLQLARLKLKEETPDLVEVATQLKSLTLQKNLIGEPVYLEAALDYVSLQAKDDQARKKVLLEKTKKDFLERSDLLSNDYHEARQKFPQKNKLFEGYMMLIDAEILLTQGETEKSKTLLEQIVNEQCGAPLLERARMLLISIDELKPKI